MRDSGRKTQIVRGEAAISVRKLGCGKRSGEAQGS